MPAAPSAAQFLKRLRARQSDDELRKIRRYFKDGGDQFIGVKMGDVFALAKEFLAMPAAEIETLLESPIHEARAGAMSIMDKQARARKTPPEQHRALFDLYLRRIDRIDNWDLVDLGAPYVVGGWLFDKPRGTLVKLAKSKNPWERRTAIVATAYFIRNGETAETFRIAGLLVKDEHDLVQKAVGGWVREAGRKDRERLIGFLDKHAATMPRVMLRYAIEHLAPAERKRYREA